MAVWSLAGGVVACPQGELARAVIGVVTAHAGGWDEEILAILEERLRFEHAGASCSLDLLLLGAGVPAHPPSTPFGTVERLDPHTDWPANDFAEHVRHVFGVREGGLIAARAFTRPTYRVGDRQVFAVGAATHPDYQGKGLGKAVVSTLLRQVSEEGGIPLWNCDARNTASLRLARAVGFTEYLWVYSWTG